MLRIITYRCPRCDYTIPAKSRAKERFDSFCPRCNQRITIWWPQPRLPAAGKRGARRKVGFRVYTAYWEALAAAIEANEAKQRVAHAESLFRRFTMDEGFVPASKLDSQLLRDLLELKRREK
jgi:DNA-directed RNA polymerase subunit RPC12/RpoP|tara:strand:+ start:369 stop:734 length:366 start_codon:yes stop_codon:yes gene_type:complete